MNNKNIIEINIKNIKKINNNYLKNKY